ncbi:unhealthy ribosome biogenesis protein 2 homolog [Latimeria chalumnae]|uniref:URB2 ribosome biosis homolog n=1 Tax=Latimeria chalumnae TaxID=7897 RepID=H2ZY10_LATCH|nr:PREDICTED: unhealthy ribosome biogenesis protein 2 homolog [Latimeria chalumnae]XP_006008383.1 PREDICTED: unhealthy ribosome biogenesis protein 2 homolog [Latimeria chalumnae]|eukprot:XP_006008382.1 PREDICTED: unhealthy ribosome biogenesis protein 2 homolog [Latimeria chalumnae]
MAAIYSGVHLKLKSTKTSWEDKLKLARFAWISHQCFLPNKEQVLIDWVIHALTGYYSNKLELEQEILEGLWVYLDQILHSKKLLNLLKEGKAINLRFSIVQVINERIAECTSQKPPVNVAIMLSCCQSILSTPPLATVYTTKCELIVDLLNKLSLLACCKLQSQEAITLQLFEVLHLAFNHYLLIQRQQVNPSRVFGQVTTHLLQSCLLLKHLLITRAWTPEDDNAVRSHLSKEIRNKINALLQSGIFLADHLSFYKAELLPQKEMQEKIKGPLKMQLVPVEVIQIKLADSNHLDPCLHYAVLSSSVPLLYKLFLDSYCKEGNQLLCFYMFGKLLDTLGISPVQNNEEMLTSNWSLALLALEQLLNSVLSNDLYNVAVDRIQHQEVQFKFFCKVAKLLLNHPQATIPAWFRCLKVLISLNHLIVEEDLDDLVSTAWVDAHITEPRVKKAQEALLGALMKTYTKLRQLPRLFEEVLAIICRPAIDELRVPLMSAGLTSKLCECLLEIPLSHTLDIWELILKKTQILVMPDVEYNSDMAIKLQTLSVLLYSVLFNMKSLDDSTPVPALRRTQCVMDKMLREMIKPLIYLLKDHSSERFSLWLEKVSNSALLLIYTWLEINNVFHLNCSRYIAPIDASIVQQESPVEDWDFCILLPEVETKCWQVVMEVASQYSSVSKYCLELLSFQKIKKILMQTDFQTAVNVKTLQNAAAYIVQSGRTASRGQLETWTGEIGTLDASSYPVAHWYLMASNLPLLIPYLSSDDVKEITDELIMTLTSESSQETTLNQGTYFTSATISKELLSSNILPEIQILHSAFVTSLIQRIKNLLHENEESILGQSLQQLISSDVSWRADCVSFNKKNCIADTQSESSESKEDSLTCWSIMETVAQNTLTSVRAPSPVKLTRAQLEALKDLLNIFSALKLDSMIPSDQTRCFLTLLSLTISLKHCSDEDTLKALRCLDMGYFLLTCLQTGRHFNSIFKVLHASDILEVVMTSLFSISECVTTCIDSPEWLKFLQTVQNFLKDFIQVIIERKQSVRLNLEKFLSFLLNCKVSTGMTIDRKSGTCNPLAEQLLLVALTTVIKVGLLYFEQKDRKINETLAVILRQAVNLMGPVTQRYLQSNKSSTLRQPFLIPAVTMLLQAEVTLRPPSSSEITNQDLVLQYSMHYKNFCLQILKELCSSECPLEFLRSTFCFLRKFCSLQELCQGPVWDGGIVQIFFSLKKLLSASWITVRTICSTQTQLKELMVCLAEGCTLEQFYTIMREIVLELEVTNMWIKGHKDVYSAVTLIKLLVGCPLSGDKEKAFWFTAPQIINALVLITREACPALTATITVPILETLADLLRQGEGIFTNPHHVTLVFSALLTVPLDHRKVEDYYRVFLAIHEVLFSVLRCHPKVMLKAAPTFLNCFNRLVVSIVHEGQQKGEKEKGTTVEFDTILKCAHLVERMYTHIAANTEDFTVFSAFIVAQYVNELQKVTLHPEVKKHLTEGIYHILDLCLERDIKFLNASLQAGVREVFKELYDNYIHYHKSKKQGEEKYTA